MELEALERQSGAYGTVNAGDTVTVSDELGKQLLANGCFKKATKKAETATADQEVERNESGISTEPVHKDATEDELRNDEGRRLSEPKPSELIEQQTESQKEVIAETKQQEQAQANAEQTPEEKAEALKAGQEVAKEKVETQKAVEAQQKEDKSNTTRQTKEDKGATAANTKQ